MRLTAVLAVLQLLVVLSGCLAGSPSGSGPDVGQRVTTQADESTVHLSSAETRLVSRSDLRATLAETGGDPDAYDLRLYYVDAEGVWHRADTDGTVGSAVPDGDVVPGIFVDDSPGASGTQIPERLDVPPSDRPVYVWKVTKTTGTPETTVVDAESGETLGVWTVPGHGRPPPTESTET
ncbi:hypothetical protein SAMN04487950_4364 [Halogranum rubrum]|uniref:Uncharacterized protein n=1 Tax=Halogranum rubrum TaxID=553466 RepID=A0A1I4J4G1_9EURY|nr:hypothetical protein [Halogranum rubrum]SFL61021.1 hypothetical protein SAMN04487950_4364 [Halogranum rubrum]